ncbi:VOC family protein [Nocardia yamanashiensis]|uniref:VOC family protein n=1 Tax=Nocardia yamanashiensis TaxID=209247 RepID=UPI00082CD153|nr:VOC family protein [Nocardia yamanashiensis]
MPTANPYLIFNGNCEEAFVFYASVLGGELRLTRFSDMEGAGEMPPEFGSRVANVALPLSETNLLYGSDCPPGQDIDNTRAGFTVSLEVESAEEAERLFNEFSAGGEVTMPYGPTEWAEAFGMVNDKYSVPWMINFTGSKG